MKQEGRKEVDLEKKEKLGWPMGEAYLDVIDEVLKAEAVEDECGPREAMISSIIQDVAAKYEVNAKKLEAAVMPDIA